MHTIDATAEVDRHQHLEQCVLPAEGMDCPSCAKTAERGLLQLEGVQSVDPDIIGQQVTVRFLPDKVDLATLRGSLGRLGYGAKRAPTVEGSSLEDRPDGVPFLARVPPHVWVGGALWALTIVGTLAGAREVIVALLASATVLVTGRLVLPRAAGALRQGSLDMHVLMAVAALGALAIGEYVEAGAVLFLFAVAGDLEHKTLSRARSEVRSLMDLSPVEATVLRHGYRVQVPVSAVRKGEIVLVRPGDRVPVDGTVFSGSSAVDASAITGESMPAPKFKDDRVFAGSVNGSGALEITCEATAADSAIGRVLKSIERARSEKSPTEAFVDQFARIYTPLVIVGALLVATLPPLFGFGVWSDWGYRALVLVVIACPCALVISTPVTVVSALTGAARRGILIKSGIHLEVLGKTRVVALDKTGTLTEGRPQIARVLAFQGTSEAEERLVLRYAAATESRSEHPIGRAIVEAATSAGIVVPRGVEMTALPGRGAYASVEGRQVVLGSPRLFGERELLNEAAKARILEAESEGSTLVLVAWSGSESELPVARGAIVLTDRVRAGVASLLPALRREGVRQVVCVSGDRSTTVRTLVEGLGSGVDGFDAWEGDLLPEDKVSWINELRRKHGPVLMVGDGVNDAPALAAADIGMAMAAHGTALALDTADVALMENELDRIPEAFRLGRKAYQIIRVNIAFALAVKLVFVALGGSGVATLWMAVAADMGSSLAVTLNGLRALKA